MRDEKIRVWITKYALSGGIFCVDAKIRHEVSPSMISWGGKFNQYAHGKDWHRTEEAAIARAEEMRQARIAAHHKSLAKLEKLVFKGPFPGGHDGSV